MVIIFRKVEVKTDMNRFWRYFSNLKLSPGSIQGVWARSRLSWMGSLPCHERSCSNLPIHHHRHQDWFTIITVIIVIIPTIHFYHQMTIVIIATNTLQSSYHGWDGRWVNGEWRILERDNPPAGWKVSWSGWWWGGHWQWQWQWWLWTMDMRETSHLQLIITFKVYNLCSMIGLELKWREEVLSSGSVLLCLHPLALMPGELYGESVFNLRPN